MGQKGITQLEKNSYSAADVAKTTTVVRLQLTVGDF